MTTRQTSIRLPERTDQQLAELAELFGDRTKALVIAVDRLHRNECSHLSEDWTPLRWNRSDGR